MKTFSAGMLAHLQQPYHRLATCWKVTLKDATVKAFTDHDQNLVIDGTTYLAASGYTATNVVSSDALNVDNLEVAGMLTSPSITEDDLRAGVWDHARIEVFIVNWSDLSQGKLLQRYGRLGEVRVGRQRFIAELRGMTQAYSRTIGHLVNPACDAVLGDARCGVNLGSPVAVSGTLSGVNDDQVTLYDSGRSEPGPSGGFTVTELDNTNPVRIVLDTSSVGFGAISEGQAVVISGVVGPTALNAMFIARDIQPSALDCVIYINVDGTALPAYVSGGTVTPLGAESGFFDFGSLTFTTGLNAGLSVEVKQYTPGQITIALPMPFEIQVGDEYTLVPGCDKQAATCRTKFDNIINFRGFPHLPGIDKVIQVARSA